MFGLVVNYVAAFFQHERSGLAVEENYLHKVEFNAQANEV